MTMAIGDTITGATEGSVLFVGPSSVLAQNNAGFYWNNSSQSLGIGTTAPIHDLTVRKSDSGTVGIDVINTNTTGEVATAQVFLQVAGPNGGDAVTVYEVFQGARWIVGIDNSDSDKFKFVANTQSAQVCLVMTTDGKIGVNEANPTARLHLPAGTASVAPLKLTAGTNLTTPGAGAVEFDGTNLFITNSNNVRRLLTSDVANVLEFGAKGDGITDDWDAFQDAATYLADTGGVIWVPPGRVYAIGFKVQIQSRHPIWIMSGMAGKALGGGFGTTHPDRAQIRPFDDVDYLFEWNHAAGDTEAQAGGGGIEGLHIADLVLDGQGVNVWRTKTLTAAVHILNALVFAVYDCAFEWLKGSAIQVGTTTHCVFRNIRIYTCGDGDVRPALDLAGPTGQVWGERLFMENNAYGNYPNITTMAPTVRVNSGCLLDLTSSYFENTANSRLITNVANNGSGLIRITAPSHGFETGNLIYIRNVGGTTEAHGEWIITKLDANTFDLQGSTFTNAYTSGGKAVPGLFNDQVFVNATEGGGLNLNNCAFNATEVTSVIVGRNNSRVTNSSFASAPRENPTIKVISNGYQSLFWNLFFTNGGQTGRSIQLDASWCQLNGICINAGGGIAGGGTRNSLSAIYVYAPYSLITGQYALDLGVDWTLNGGIVDLSGSSCNGIQSNSSSVSNMRVIARPAGSIGIASTQSSDVIADNFVDNTNGGTPYSFVNGTNAWNNYPWPDGLVYRNAAASGPVSETVAEAHFDKSYTIPSNRLRAGAAIRVRAQALVTSATGGGTLNLRLKIGSTVIQQTGAVTAGSSFIGYFDSTLIVRTIGAAGTLVGTTLYGLGTYDVVSPKLGFLGSTSIDTTASQTVKLSAQWSVAHSGNSARLEILSVEILSSGDVG